MIDADDTVIYNYSNGKLLSSNNTGQQKELDLHIQWYCTFN